MKDRRKKPRPVSFEKSARVGSATKRRYENAWDESVGYDVPPPAPVQRQILFSRLAQGWRSRTGKVVMLAPIFGVLGAYLFYRRRK